MPLPVDQVRSRPADRLGDQAAGTSGDIEHRGVKLHKLHIAQLAPGPPGQSHAVAAGPFRIRRLAVQLPRAAGGQDRPPGPHERFAVGLVPDQRAAATPFKREQIDRERLWPNLQIFQQLRPLDHGPHHLPPRRIPKRMHDPMMAVPPLASQFEAAVALIKLRAPGDQLGNPLRRLAHHRLHHIGMAQPAAGGERVGDMVVKSIFRVDHPGDATLRPLAGGGAQVVFCDHGDGEFRGHRQRGSQAGEPTPQDEHVGETVRHSLGTKRGQIPRAFEHAVHSSAVPCV